VLGVNVRPGQIHDWIRELAAFLLVKLPHVEENLRHKVLIQASLARRRNGCVLSIAASAPSWSWSRLFFSEGQRRAGDTPWC